MKESAFQFAEDGLNLTRFLSISTCHILIFVRLLTPPIDP